LDRYSALGFAAPSEWDSYYVSDSKIYIAEGLPPLLQEELTVAINYIKTY